MHEEFPDRNLWVARFIVSTALFGPSLPLFWSFYKHYCATEHFALWGSWSNCRPNLLFSRVSPSFSRQACAETSTSENSRPKFPVYLWLSQKHSGILFLQNFQGLRWFFYIRPCLSLWCIFVAGRGMDLRRHPLQCFSRQNLPKKPS